MLKFFESLPIVERVGHRVLDIDDKVAIMTHDDTYDEEFDDFEQKYGYTSTTFIFHHRINNNALRSKMDMQIHYNKFSQYALADQIESFTKAFRKKPTINRNHRLWWRESHLDLAHLAMHGIEVDSTLIGVRPFQLVAEQRLYPIWEVPFSITDPGAISLKNSASCAHNLAINMETLFKKQSTPIVGLFHPYLKQKSQWKEFFAFAEKYKYKIMNMSQFKKSYLKQ